MKANVVGVSRYYDWPYPDTGERVVVTVISPGACRALSPDENIWVDDSGMPTFPPDMLSEKYTIPKRLYDAIRRLPS